MHIKLKNLTKYLIYHNNICFDFYDIYKNCK